MAIFDILIIVIPVAQIRVCLNAQVLRVMTIAEFIPDVRTEHGFILPGTLNIITGCVRRCGQPEIRA